MKLKADCDCYKLPKMEQLVEVVIDFGSKKIDDIRYRLVVLSLRELLAMRTQPYHLDGSRGRTAYCAIRPATIVGAEDELLLSPMPRKNGTLEIRYYPPIEVA